MTRRCRVCGVEKECSAENFYHYRNGKIDTRCKPCSRTYYLRRYYKDVNAWRERERIKYRNRSDSQKIKDRTWHRAWTKRPEGIFNTYKKRARDAGLEFSLSKEDFFRLLGKACVYCGQLAMGVDRLNNLIGYRKDNCASCCGRCNKMKLDMTIEEFLTQCRMVLEHVPWPHFENEEEFIKHTTT